MFNIAKIQTDENGNIIAYKVDNSKTVPVIDGNRDYEELKILMQGYRDVQVADGVDADGKTIWITVRETFEPLVPEPEFTEAELLEKSQVNFRAERDALIREADIEIFKLEDNSMDSTSWREYRQALRDSTLTWVLPAKP